MTFRATEWVLLSVVTTGLLGGAAGALGQESSAAPNADSVATPRMADGHPDLTGYWITGGPEVGLGGGGEKVGANGESLSAVADLRHGKFSNLENDAYLMMESGDNLPPYKAEFWAQIEDNERNASAQDPYLHCMPDVPPRLGPPLRIVQSSHDFLFFNADLNNQYRDIPAGPMAYPPQEDGSYEGDAASHWDGDTLVVETVGFNDQSWFSRAGYIHGFGLKTIERLHRQGNELTYDVTVEDPEYLQKPWVLPTAHRHFSDKGFLIRTAPCVWHDFPATLGSTLG